MLIKAKFLKHFTCNNKVQNNKFKIQQFKNYHSQHNHKNKQVQHFKIHNNRNKKENIVNNKK